MSGAGVVGSASAPKGSSVNATAFFLRFLSDGSNRGSSAAMMSVEQQAGKARPNESSRLLPRGRLLLKQSGGTRRLHHGKSIPLPLHTRCFCKCRRCLLDALSPAQRWPSQLLLPMPGTWQPCVNLRCVSSPSAISRKSPRSARRNWRNAR